MEPTIDIKDVQQLLGERDLIIHQLQKEVARLQALVQEGKPPAALAAVK